MLEDCGMKLCSTSFVLPILFCAAIAASTACRPAKAPGANPEGDGEAPASEADAGTGLEAAADEAHPAPAEGTGSSGNVGAGASALAEVLVTDASEIQRIFEAAKAAPKATTKANGLAAAGALPKGLREFAKTAASGMKADGPLITGKLEEKKNVQTEITLKPGKCYAIVGYSAKVTDLDLYLFLPPGILSGQDLTDDTKPVIGKTPDAMCPVAKSAVKYTLDIVADQGAGEFAVQLFSKKAPKKGK
jgi:hypothetical protein